MANEWYYQIMGETIGPLSAAELRKRAAEGRITPDTRVRKDAAGKWVPGWRVKGLFDPRSASAETAEDRDTSETERRVADSVQRQKPRENKTSGMSGVPPRLPAARNGGERSLVDARERLRLIRVPRRVWIAGAGIGVTLALSVVVMLLLLRKSPEQEFEEFSRSVYMKLPDVRFDDNKVGVVVVEDARYEVHETRSLTSPLVATLELDLRLAVVGDMTIPGSDLVAEEQVSYVDVQLEFTYAHQEDVWLLKNVRKEGIDLIGKDGSTLDFTESPGTDPLERLDASLRLAVVRLRGGSVLGRWLFTDDWRVLRLFARTPGIEEHQVFPLCVDAVRSLEGVIIPPQPTQPDSPSAIE